jgi:L-threonylcarbamoyladenylate synthase
MGIGDRDDAGPALDAADASALERCVRDGGIAIFPADTVYGICCDPSDERAVARLYELKGRTPRRAAAIMFFDLALALRTLEPLPRAERAALAALLPGAVTLLLGNPRALFAAASGEDPATLGLRVPALPPRLAALAAVGVPVMQSSANLSGGADARELAGVPERLRNGADLVLDGGPLPGKPSTVVDLRGLESGGEWTVLREGALASAEVARALTGAAVRPAVGPPC